jgi:hypothetical protein
LRRRNVATANKRNPRVFCPAHNSRPPEAYEALRDQTSQHRRRVIGSSDLRQGHYGQVARHPEHRCRPPQRATRGTVYVCWCGRRWVATDSITIRDGKVSALRPDWRFVAKGPT